MRKSLQIVALTALLVGSFLLPSFIQAKTTVVNAGLQTTQTRVLRSADDGITFSLETPRFVVQQDGTPAVAGLDAATAVPGSPSLPYFSAYIALPPEATARVAVELRSVSRTAVSQAIPPAPHALPDPSVQLPEEISQLPEHLAPDAAVYGRNALYPTATYELSEPMYYRDTRLVALRLYPVRYNPVANEIEQAQRMEVTVTFAGGTTAAAARPLQTLTPTQDRILRSLVINPDQAHQWRSLPAGAQAPATELPVGTDTFKIAVDADGIYEVTGTELAAAGMNLAGVNPISLEMLHRGEPVAYEFIDNDGDGNFDADDRIRFYGWAFDGTRAEKQFADDNIFWLWAGGNRTTISSVANQAGSGFPVVESFRDSITREPENYFFATWTNKWPEFPNEADSFYWDYIDWQPSSTPDVVTRTYTIDLPNPVPDAVGNSFLAEIMTREFSLAGGQRPTYTVAASMNTETTEVSETWKGTRNLNLVGTIDGAELAQDGDAAYPSNEITVSFSAADATRAQYYLNRITVEYARQLAALDDELVFTSDQTGQHEFHISGFSQGNAGSVLVWDITNPREPRRIIMTSDHIDAGSTYTYKLGSSHGADARFIATTLGNVRDVKSVERYRPVSLDAPGGGADWVAISHANFIGAARQLADHRAANGLKTFVVDIEDVINQYGYGFNMPGAIRNYLAHALSNWNTPPSFIMLFGDATINPRQLVCPEDGPEVACSGWNNAPPTYLVTDLQFVDRYNGLIPSDLTLALLVGDDLLADVEIGRAPVNTAKQATDVVNKIITYGRNITTPSNRNVLFVADDPDSGGNFCVENAATSTHIPDYFNKVFLCLSAPEEEPTNELREDMGQWINDVGVSILNYRGHGSLSTWAATSNSPALLSTAQLDFWLNENRPVVILSADCLDGHFAWPGTPALGETFLKETGSRGSAAHWSSAGLGFTYEHTILAEGFYDAIFQMDLRTIGEAVTYSKTNYAAGNYHESELYSFNLLGDPAMPLVQDGILLPAIIGSE